MSRSGLPGAFAARPVQNGTNIHFRPEAEQLFLCKGANGAVITVSESAPSTRNGSAGARKGLNHGD